MIIMWGFLLVVYVIGMIPFAIWSLDEDNSVKVWTGGIGFIVWSIMFPAVVFQLLSTG